MEYNFNKGSEWHKWDLHFHTQSSYDYSDQSVTNEEIINTLLQNDISVVAITDHHVIDINRIRELQKLSNGRITILPGIECCSELGGSTSIHFIGIFPENCDIESLWTKIQGKHNLTDSDKRTKGNEKIICKFEETCKTIISLGGIVTVHAGNKSNSIESIKNTLLVKQELKTELLSNYISILEIGDISDKAGYENNVFPSIKLVLPIIICSDNHNVKNYELKENLWIKADTSFEGLKQVLCEPKERILIQKHQPELKKTYNIIDRIEFVNKNNSTLFTDSIIGFSSGLNAIIGGKSSGKSLLLHLIAKKLGKTNDDYIYEPDIFNNVDIKVYYKNDTENEVGTIDTRIIEFLPQLHINKIVKEQVNNEKKETAFNEFIEKLLCENEHINNVLTNFKFEHRVIMDGIEQSIKDWCLLNDELRILKAEKIELGDKAAIISVVNLKQHEIDNLTAQANLTPENKELYTEKTTERENLVEEKTKTQIEIDEYQRLLAYIDTLPSTISNIMSFYSPNDRATSLWNETQIAISSSITTQIENLKNQLNTDIAYTQQTIKNVDEKIALINKSIQPLIERDEILQKIDLLEKEQKEERLNVNIIIKKEEEIESIREKMANVPFLENYTKLNDLYYSLSTILNNEIENKWKSEIKNLEIKADTIFNSENFVNTIKSIVNVKTYLANQFKDCHFENNDFYIYDNNEHLNNIKNLIRQATNEVERFDNFKQGFDTKDFLDAILKDCFYISYDVIKGSDNLRLMSEGKKGIALLQLYLSLSKSEYPILIDQPEDNLDNRTIYQELNEYIKECKKQRQIIMVTHNANLVVNTDTENIIVANQADEDGRGNNKFKFEYINGPLEKTFTNNLATGVLYQKGIREHVCDILEGGAEAFKKREEKYHIKKNKKN